MAHLNNVLKAVETLNTLRESDTLSDSGARYVCMSNIGDIEKKSWLFAVFNFVGLIFRKDVTVGS